MPSSISRSSAGACTTSPAQTWQAYLGRRVTIPLNCAGITSSRSETSSPIRCLRPPQHAHHVDDDLFAWEVDRQRTAIDVPPARRGLLLSGGVVLRRGVCRRERLFHVFQRQCQLLGIEPFGAAPEAMPLQLLDDCGQPLELLGMMRPLGQEQSTQAIEIGGEGIDRKSTRLNSSHSQISYAV